MTIRPVFSKQPLQGGEPRLHGIEPAGIGFHLVETSAKIGLDLTQPDLDLPELRCPSLAVGLPGRDRFQAARCLTQRLVCRTVGLEQELRGLAEPATDGLGMSKHLPLPSQLDLLARLDTSIVQLRELKTQEVDALLPHALVARKAFQTIRCRFPSRERSAHLGQQIAAFSSAGAIEPRALELRIHEPELFALSVKTQE